MNLLLFLHRREGGGGLTPPRFHCDILPLCPGQLFDLDNSSDPSFDRLSYILPSHNLPSYILPSHILPSYNLPSHICLGNSLPR